MEIYEEVRGITCDITGLTPLRDYRFRISVRNRFGVSDPSPYSVAHRQVFQMFHIQSFYFIDHNKCCFTLKSHFKLLCEAIFHLCTLFYATINYHEQ